MDETIASIEALDYDEMYDDLRDSLNDIADAQWMLIQFGMSDSYTAGTLKQSYQSLRETFDIILLDPPYVAGLLEPAIAHIARFDILAPHGIIVAEHPAEKTLPALSAPYRVHRTYRYGKIGLTIYRRGGNEENEEQNP